MIQAANIPFGLRGAAVFAALAVAGCADVERGFSDRELDRFVAAMIAVECKVGAENAGVVEKATGFSEEKLGKITGYLREKQLVVRTDDLAGIILINEGCP